MIDDTAAPADTPVPPSYPVVVDAVLWSFVRVAYTGGMELGLTLLIGGRKIGGILVSPSKWMAQIAEGVGAESTGDDEVLAGVFRQVSAQFEEEQDEARAKYERGEEDDELLHFVHLLDAGVDGELAERRPWRVRLADVQGWTIGYATLT